jgi:hypothetical protein
MHRSEARLGRPGTVDGLVCGSLVAQPCVLVPALNLSNVANNFEEDDCIGITLNNELSLRTAVSSVCRMNT